MTVRIIILALISMMGIFGLLLSSGIWDIVFLALAALPVLLGCGFVVLRQMK